ncbi:pantoate--beta-alanine ligase [Herbihabitans rhizosphaerae]|uniref:Pantothenate synthetase n=1 Tax=Herbihabitans rhizosphaerae TaxID=1872711 RepID=A0A4Q7KXY1_9PSEU|nr:pantoate--beta-alanine ligase [Herbihabitans rhizosphaerae]RZS41210.1 pantoate--beta-alanine ligase [Herbihabitans rhizosphaerae]
MTAEIKLGELTVYSGPSEFARVTRALRGTGRQIAFVPTMGALHEGHRELLRRARRIPNAVLVASIFVNPLQFNDSRDLERYPRPLETDLDVCRAERVDLAFTPSTEDVYPPGADTTVQPGRLGELLEGAHRPGHFAGVLTVVAKLFNIVRPDFALFGEKDYQQLTLIKRMVADLNMDTAVIGVPTVREPDGLALSSRNALLSTEDRELAVTLSAALTAGAYAGPHGPDVVRAAARAVADAEPKIDWEYLELTDPDLGPAPDSGPARLLVAAKVGQTRLIDNVPVQLGTG